ncbi:MAG: hypothetical protein RSA70_01910 [Clostridia bacterium]
MKRLGVAIIAACMMIAMGASAFAAQPATCPRGGGKPCISSACKNRGSCPNGGVPKHDGTGRQNGGHGAGHRGGNCGR